MISDLLAAVHCVYVTPEEIARLAAAGASVVHCPVSNLKLGSGIAPVVAMREAGLNVALGTDGAASNDTLDMLSEARFAALLAGGVTRNAAAVPAAAALEMATLCGARALGLDDQIGSLVPGKSADVCCIDLSSPMTQPVLDVAEALLHAASRRSVSDVWVAGRHLVADGQLTRMDSMELARRAQGWQARVMSAHDGLAKA
jgi:5-methylthioadenosine/S-adenosylhomocysteine deaminase